MATPCARCCCLLASSSAVESSSVATSMLPRVAAAGRSPRVLSCLAQRPGAAPSPPAARAARAKGHEGARASLRAATSAAVNGAGFETGKKIVVLPCLSPFFALLKQNGILGLIPTTPCMAAGRGAASPQHFVPMPTPLHAPWVLCSRLRSGGAGTRWAPSSGQGTAARGLRCPAWARAEMPGAALLPSAPSRCSERPAVTPSPLTAPWNGLHKLRVRL